MQVDPTSTPDTRPPLPVSPATLGVSIRVLVAAITVLPAAVVAIILVSLLSVTTSRISERLEESMLRTATQRVGADVTTFLDEAVRISNLYARRVDSGVLSLSDLRTWERFELDEMAVTPGIASISYGNRRGEAVMVLRRAGQVELDRVAADGSAGKFLPDLSSGTLPDKPALTFTYDPRSRPWYIAALAADSPSWTPIYVWLTANIGDPAKKGENGTGYARPIRDAGGQVAGVLIIDVTLGGLSDFLRTLPIAADGSVYIIDEQGMLIAASNGPVNSADQQPISFAAAYPPLAHVLAQALGETPASSKSEKALRLNVDGARTRVRTSDLHPYPGINWRVIAAIPEDVLLGDARTLQHRALWAGGAAIVASLIFGIFISRRISRPIRALASHVQRVSSGDFDSRLNLRAAREFHALSDELNSMAGSLKQRMDLEQSLAVAKEVQQSLLPRQSPTTPGLDIAGTSRYCDATGGDYYDFIELMGIAGQGGEKILVAVGDVSGHGVASALLMATARGALRACISAATTQLSLSSLLSHVNRVLAKDASGGGFMTMILLILDPSTRTVRWSSAGHGPPLIHDPSGRLFDNMPAGDIPLGIDEYATFDEHIVNDLSPRAVIFLGTDGIWEALNSQGEMFGEDRLHDIIKNNAGRPSSVVLRAIDQQVAEFCGTSPARDDITAVIIQSLQSPIKTANAP